MNWHALSNNGKDWQARRFAMIQKSTFSEKLLYKCSLYLYNSVHLWACFYPCLAQAQVVLGGCLN
jgi:hypothetical protein